MLEQTTRLESEMRARLAEELKRFEKEKAEHRMMLSQQETALEERYKRLEAECAGDREAMRQASAREQVVAQEELRHEKERLAAHERALKADLEQMRQKLEAQLNKERAAWKEEQDTQWQLVSAE